MLKYITLKGALISVLTLPKTNFVSSYAFTVLSNLAVYGIFWLLFILGSDTDVSSLGPGDAYKFQVRVFGFCWVFFVFFWY